LRFLRHRGEVGCEETLLLPELAADGGGCHLRYEAAVATPSVLGEGTSGEQGDPREQREQTRRGARSGHWRWVSTPRWSRAPRGR
jgi:hypothetical protein